MVQSKKCKRNPGYAAKRKTGSPPPGSRAPLPARPRRVPARGNIHAPAKHGPGTDRSVLCFFQLTIILEIVAVSQGCHNNGPQIVWLKQQTFILLSSGGQKCEIQVSTVLLPSGCSEGESFLASYSTWWPAILGL